MKISEIITEASIFGRKKNKVYNLMIKAIGCGPFDGGCVTVAMALKVMLGGDIVVLTGYANRNSPEEAAQHAALLHNGKLIDGDGPLPQKAFINRFVDNEMAFVGGSVTGVRPIEPNDLPEAPRDAAVARQIAELLQS